jgi:hypothetical protein
MATVALVPGVMDTGFIVAVTPAGAFTVSPTTFLAAPVSATLTVNVPVLPACTVPAGDDAVSAKSGPVAPTPTHALTSREPSTDPNPVASLYVAPLAVNPITPGTLLFPDGVA